MKIHKFYPESSLQYSSDAITFYIGAAAAVGFSATYVTFVAGVWRTTYMMSDDDGVAMKERKEWKSGTRVNTIIELKINFIYINHFIIQHTQHAPCAFFLYRHFSITTIHPKPIIFI